MRLPWPVIAASCLGLLPPALHGQRATAGVITEGPIIYHVTMTTTFVVPASNRVIDQIRIWHALPTLQPWSNTSDIGATDLQWSPDTGEQKYEPAHDSHHVFWQEDGQLAPGRPFTFTSRFSVRSVARSFTPEAVSVSWKDYDQPRTDKEAVVSAGLAGAVHPELAKVADAIKRDRAPPDAVREFCRWIVNTITYDAAVPYATDDIASILARRRGHCGHQCCLLQQLCARVGIPLRFVVGLNLYAPDGRTGGLQAVRADFTNIHTWAEVWFPNVSWVEVEPGAGAKAFTLAARFIQNDKWFQNYAIWIRENGVDKIPEWISRGGKFVSDYGVTNLIQFTASSDPAEANAIASMTEPSKRRAILIKDYGSTKLYQVTTPSGETRILASDEATAIQMAK